jgi:hypothetical protein
MHFSATIIMPEKDFAPFILEPTGFRIGAELLTDVNVS